jgi:hypothetical protein
MRVVALPRGQAAMKRTLTSLNDSPLHALRRHLADMKKAGKSRPFSLTTDRLDQLPLAAPSTVSPAFCTSLPAPATVLQPDSMATENIDNSISAITRFMGFSWLFKFNTEIRSRLSEEHASAAPLPDLQCRGFNHTAPREVQSGGRGVQRM